jgi:uncharacterized protein (DUF885 family)
VTETTTQPTAMDQVSAAFWEEYLRQNPTSATVYGDTRYDDLLPDPSKAGRVAGIEAVRAAADAAGAIPDDTLTVEDRVTRGMLQLLAALAERDEALGAYEIRAVDQIYGPQTLLPQVATFQHADTPEGLERWLDRLRAYGPFVDANIEILHEARASGRTSARIVAERTIDQLRRLVDTPIEEAVIPALSKVASDEDRERVRQVVRDVVYPADRRYLEALSGEYLGATREQPGLVSAPDGDTLYRYFIQRWTTLELEPRDVHQIGLDELATIDDERRAIAQRAGYGGDVDGYRAALVADPANQAASVEELVARAGEDIERAAAIAPRVFGKLPRAACIVKPVEPFKEQDAPFAYYYPPTIDGTRPGTYYVNTYDLPSRSYHKLAATTFHEAIPGHHFQIALEMENPELNVFRRLGARFVAGAYLEGWGLYAERLADELALYRNDAERLGMLDAQAWRASRLITDSGMHALGWSRQQSIDWLLRTGLSETDAIIETDRYIAWPGQALTYMIGMREIRRLRQELEARDGDRFDLTGFHDELIGHGSLPLVTLAAELPGWVKPSA